MFSQNKLKTKKMPSQNLDSVNVKIQNYDLKLFPRNSFDFICLELVTPVVTDSLDDYNIAIAMIRQSLLRNLESIPKYKIFRRAKIKRICRVENLMKTLSQAEVKMLLLNIDQLENKNYN